MARKALTSQARLIHLDLAGRYSIRAASCAPAAEGAGDSAYYVRLEKGARYLASIAPNDADRDVHLGIANRYARLAMESAPRNCPPARQI